MEFKKVKIWNNNFTNSHAKQSGVPLWSVTENEYTITMISNEELTVLSNLEIWALFMFDCYSKTSGCENQICRVLVFSAKVTADSMKVKMASKSKGIYCRDGMYSFWNIQAFVMFLSPFICLKVSVMLWAFDNIFVIWKNPKLSETSFLALLLLDNAEYITWTDRYKDQM